MADPGAFLHGVRPTKASRPVRNVQREMRTAATLAILLPDRVASAIRELHDHADTMDGYPSTASGADTGITSASTSSSTERAALDRMAGRLLRRSDGTMERLSGPTADLEEIADLVGCLVHVVGMLHRKCDAIGGGVTKADVSRLRCVGTGDVDGAACGQLFDPTRSDGRCIDCGRNIDTAKRRERRNRQRDVA